MMQKMFLAKIQSVVRIERKEYLRDRKSRLHRCDQKNLFLGESELWPETWGSFLPSNKRYYSIIICIFKDDFLPFTS